ncbi:hypothetical protein PF008_g10245 [Phytophthora fragariae]|uniref:Uncharacterized protein n=1 Tax=Phytophthora fragariae TaxID=53985 RepID=A0A6G0RUC2_9STRA|nr:hypothetical protein PF008_g10245 [Phytophthora fragariae]
MLHTQSASSSLLVLDCRACARVTVVRAQDCQTGTPCSSAILTLSTAPLSASHRQSPLCKCPSPRCHSDREALA